VKQQAYFREDLFDATPTDSLMASQPALDHAAGILLEDACKRPALSIKSMQRFGQQPVPGPQPREVMER
jgi:hypothetical protein